MKNQRKMVVESLLRVPDPRPPARKRKDMEWSR